MEGVESAPIAQSHENATLLLIERLKNPKIKAQLVSLYEEAYAARARNPKPIIRPVCNPVTGKELRDTEGAFILESVPYTPPSREEIERMIDERVEGISAVTDIAYLDKNVTPNNEAMNLNWKLPWSGESPNTEQWSVIEGHEKGHNVRQYGHADIAEYFTTHFLEGFDLAAMEFNDWWYQQLTKEQPDLSFDVAKEAFYATMSDPMELAERMSQLKNYFGMRGAEPFTKEHLVYARAHYISDTGYDNLMTPFFEGITPDKEERFLELMNTSGI